MCTCVCFTINRYLNGSHINERSKKILMTLLQSPTCSFGKKKKNVTLKKAKQFGGWGKEKKLG